VLLLDRRKAHRDIAVLKAREAGHCQIGHG
jgi:hypothetical protein